MTSMLNKLFFAYYITTISVDSFKNTRLQFNRYCLTSRHDMCTIKPSSDSSSATNRNKNLYKIKNTQSRSLTSGGTKHKGNKNQTTDSKVKVSQYSEDVIVYEYNNDNDNDEIIISSGTGQKEYLEAFVGPRPMRHGKTHLVGSIQQRLV